MDLIHSVDTNLSDTVIEKIKVDPWTLLDSTLTPSRKRKDWRRKIPQWELHRGTPFLLQVHKAILALNTNHCTVTSTRESKLSNFVILDFSCPETEKLSIRLEPGDEYLENSSKLAIVYLLEKTSIPLLNELNSFKPPLNIMFNPKSKNKQMIEDLNRIENKTLVFQGALEPQKYSRYMHGDVIRIFYDETKIKSYLSDLTQLDSNARWVQFRHGNLARNNPELLSKIFKVMKLNDMALLDYNKQYQDQLRKKCVEFDLNCHFPSSLKSNKTSVERLETALYRTRKSGENILVLKATVENLKLINDYSEVIQRQGTTLVPLDDI